MSASPGRSAACVLGVCGASSPRRRTAPAPANFFMPPRMRHFGSPPRPVHAAPGRAPGPQCAHAAAPARANAPQCAQQAAAAAPALAEPPAWPRDFSCAGASPLSESARRQVRHQLLHPAPGTFVPAGKAAVVLSPSCAAGVALPALAECGERACSCTRLTKPHVRPRFREEVVRLACTGGRELIDGMEYVSLAGGCLLYTSPSPRDS